MIVYTFYVKIICDESKRLANLAKHGLDFADFEHGFSWDCFLEVKTKPSKTGRKRIILVGMLNAELVVAAIISPLGSQALSLVSLRPASEKERKAYEQI